MYDYKLLEQVRMWRHKKTGNIYWIVGIAECGTNGAMNGTFSVVYTTAEGGLYNRDVPEFLDGRFEPMNSTALKSLKG